MMSDREWRLRAALRALGRALLWLWHETFSYHDYRCTEQHFLLGSRVSVLECDCGSVVEIRP